MGRTPILLILCAVLLPGQQPVWEKELNAWLQKSSGEACPEAEKVTVAAQGRLKVQAANRRNVSYSWTQRVTGVSRAEAERRMKAAQIRASEENGWCLIVANGSQVPGVVTELTVTVPRSVKSSRLKSRSGGLSVKYLDGEVNVGADAGSIEMDEIGGNVQAVTGGGMMSFGTLRGTLRCLSGGGAVRVDKVGPEAVIETAGGDIHVGEAAGWLRLSTAGNIHVGRAGQWVVARSSAGLIEVEQAGGMVTAESAGGGIVVGGARGVSCESAAGGIRLSNVSGSIRATAVAGSVVATLASGAALERSFLSSGSGDITVFVPSNLAVTVKALNDSAGLLRRVISEFPEFRVQAVEAGYRSPLTVQGALNGGGPELVLAASGGSIYLRRLR